MKNNYLLLSSKKFKTNFIQIKYVLEANEMNATYASLLSLYLSYVNQNNPNYKKAINHLDSLYGVTINAFTSLRGDQISFDFVISFVANRYLNKDQYLLDVINTLFDYLFNPLVVNETFDQAIFKLKKNELQEKIEILYDDKMAYALNSFFNIFATNYPLAINMDGNLEILNEITTSSLYDFYQKMIKQTPFVGGMIHDFDYDFVKEKLLQTISETTYDREYTHYHLNNLQIEEKIVRQDIVQSKLVVGYTYNKKINKKSYFNNLVLNSLLGMSSNSYLFKIIREKENLCYGIRSNYDHYSNTFFIMAGIEKENYQKTVNLIEMIINDIKSGKITIDEFQDAKTVVIDQINKINDSQFAYVNYFINRQFQSLPMNLDEDIEIIKKLEIKDIVAEVQNLELKTKYLLSGEKNE